jgi:FkbM family methyltransferase
MKPLLVGEGIYRAVYNEFLYEYFWNVVGLFLSNRNVKTIVDIGASSGLSALMFLDYPVVEKIICFEPDENNYKDLLINLGPYMDKVIPYNFGIYYGKEESDVYGIGDNSPLGYFIDGVKENSLGEFYKDSAVKYGGKKFKLSELEKHVNFPVDLIKMDVEGSEYNIVPNSTIVKETKYLIISFHNYPFTYVYDFIRKNLPEHDIRYAASFTNTDIFLERH